MFLVLKCIFSGFGAMVSIEFRLNKSQEEVAKIGNKMGLSQYLIEYD